MIEELYTLLKEKHDVKNPEDIWRLARAAYEKSKITDDKEQKKKLVYEAFNYIESALQLDDNNFACHKVYLY